MYTNVRCILIDQQILIAKQILITKQIILLLLLLPEQCIQHRYLARDAS